MQPRTSYLTQPVAVVIAVVSVYSTYVVPPSGPSCYNMEAGVV